MTGLRWSRRTTTTIAEELAKLGIAVSPNTVARLLHDMGYSLRVNQKQISTSSSPNRNLQFEYLAELRHRFQRRHLPIVSVDSKKRELVGNFKNPGRRWESAPLVSMITTSAPIPLGSPFLMEFTMLCGRYMQHRRKRQYRHLQRHQLGLCWHLDWAIGVRLDYLAQHVLQCGYAATQRHERLHAGTQASQEECSRKGKCGATIRNEDLVVSFPVTSSCTIQGRTCAR
jgi:Rhodopirellula transposase DDE domain